MPLTDYADLPGPRFAALKAWAAPIPDWSAIPAGRRTTVTDSGNLATNATNLQTALDTARAQTGGDRLVILPDNFQCRGALTLGVNADTAHDIILVPQRVVDGTYPLTRYVRVPSTRPSWVPRLFTNDSSTAGFQDTLITTTFDPATDRWRIYGVDLRVYTLAATNDECFALVDHGQYGAALSGGFPDPTLCTGWLQISHCWTGGTALDSAGAWRPYNLDRCIYDASTGFAANDCYNSEHGSLNASDNGFWDSIIGQGPVWINNIGGDSFGGIAYMSGGFDVPSSFPNCADVKIEYCHIKWDARFAGRAGVGYPRPAGATLDVNGADCPWPVKNQGEIKNGERHQWHRNVYEGYWRDGQVNVLGVKANQQAGAGRLDATDHITIDECVIVPFDCEAAIVLLLVSADDGFSVDPIGHGTVRGNYLRSPKNFIQLGPHTGTTEWTIHNNGYDPIAGGTYFAPFFADTRGDRADTAAWLGLSGQWDYCRNAMLGTPFFPDGTFLIEGGIGTSGYGFGPFWAQMQSGGCTVTCVDNVTPPSLQTPDYGSYTTNQHPAGVAAMGVTRGANGLYQHDVGSMLLTAANGGTELSGPDLALISSIYDAVAVGDVRALMAAEEGAPVATQLLLSTQPAGAVSGVALATQPSGTVADSGGSTVTSDTGTVTAAWVSLTGDASPSGTLNAVCVAGAWAFSTLALTWTVTSTGYWSFTDGSLTAVTSDVMTLLAGSIPQPTLVLPTVTDQWRPTQRNREGLEVAPSASPLIGTGGTTLTGSATTSVFIPVGRVKVSVLSLSIDAMQAASGSGAITAQVFSVKGGVSTALTAAQSIKADGITQVGNVALPVLPALFDGASNGSRRIDGTVGNTLRVDLVAAGTVTQQPLLRVVAELAING